MILKNEHGSQNPVTEEARYKILAIENEAPDFIKTDHRIFGRVEIDRKGVYDVENDASDSAVTDAVPDGLISEIKIRTSDDNWSGYNEGGQIRNTDFEGTKKVRIVGTYVPDGGDVNSPIEAFSPWRTVSRIKGTGSRRGCDIQEVFLAGDVDMYQKINAILSNPDEITPANVDNPGESYETGDYIKYWMEFKDEVVENKPQFDGRFFVKILKDEVLSQNVLGIAAGIGNYQVADTYAISYIVNQDTNPANDDAYYPGDQEAFTWPTNPDGEDVGGFGVADISQWIDDDGNADTPNVPKFGIGDTTNTELFWEWWAEQVDEGNASSIFIDQAPCYTGYIFWQQLDFLNVPDNAPEGTPGIMEGNILQFFGSGYTPLNITGYDTGNWQPAGLS